MSKRKADTESEEPKQTPNKEEDSDHSEPEDPKQTSYEDEDENEKEEEEDNETKTPDIPDPEVSSEDKIKLKKIKISKPEDDAKDDDGEDEEEFENNDLFKYIQQQVKQIQQKSADERFAPMKNKDTPVSELNKLQFFFQSILGPHFVLPSLDDKLLEDETALDKIKEWSKEVIDQTSLNSAEYELFFAMVDKLDKGVNWAAEADKLFKAAKRDGLFLYDTIKYNLDKLNTL